MKRLTTDTPQTNSETALNLFYAKDGQAWARGGGGAFAENKDRTLYDYARMLIKQHKAMIEICDDNMELGEELTDCLWYGPGCIEGLIATLYTTAWAFAEIRARLKQYEDEDERGLLIHLPDVPDRDRESIRDLLADAKAEWIHDPSVGLYGPNEDEEALLTALLDGLLLKGDA